jgi:hypothetical protein
VTVQFGRQVRFVPRTVDRDVLVASGPVQIHLLPKEMKDMVAIYVGKRSGNGISMHCGPVTEFLGDVGEMFDLKAINETTPRDKQCCWHFYLKPDQILAPGARAELLKNLSDQTGIVFKIERRPVEIWFVESSPGVSSGR